VQYVYYKSWLALGYLLVLIVIYLSLTATPPPLPSFEYSDKAGHLLAYASLTGWFGQLYTRVKTQIWIFLAFCLMGVSLEFIQGMGETRVFEYADMLANSIGAALGWLLTRTLMAGSLLRFEKLFVNT